MGGKKSPNFCRTQALRLDGGCGSPDFDATRKNGVAFCLVVLTEGVNQGAVSETLSVSSVSE